MHHSKKKKYKNHPLIVYLNSSFRNQEKWICRNQKKGFRYIQFIDSTKPVTLSEEFLGDHERVKQKDKKRKWSYTVPILHGQI